MPPIGFEPTIPASELPQTYALDRVVTGIDRVVTGIDHVVTGNGLPTH
jgi:hypothetical protein